MVPESTPRLDAALRTLAHPEGPSDIDDVLVALDLGLQEDLTGLVRDHRLECAFVDVLTTAGLPVPEDLEDVVADDRLMRLQVMAALRAAGEALDAAAIPWLTFKGPVVAALMARPELRTYNDLDLLVPADRFEAAIDVLVAAGIEEMNENWAPYVRHRVGEVPMAAGAVSVDLHWHVIGLGRHRRSIRFDPPAMLERCRLVEVAGTPTPTFDAVDQLLHLAVHAALSGATRLDQLRDLAVVVARDPVDWDEFRQRAAGVGVASLVAHSLDRAGRVLGAPVNDAVLRRMAGGSLDRRRRLDADAVGGLRGAGIWWRRDRPLASARAAVDRLADSALRVPGRPRGWDFVDEDSRLYYGRRSGGPAGRAEYLRRVSGWH